MSDLISRSALLEELKRELERGRANDPFFDGTLFHYTGIKAIIENQPTAYDVDKVVKELEDKAQDRRNRAYMIPNAEVSLFAQYLLGMAVGLEDEAIEIVKGGGVNERVH